MAKLTTKNIDDIILRMVKEDDPRLTGPDPIFEQENRTTLRILRNIKESIGARESSRADTSLGVPQSGTAGPQYDLRAKYYGEPGVSNRASRGPKLVSIGVNPTTGERKYVELPADYAQRKRFRKLQLDEISRPRRERKLAAGRVANRAKSIANLRNPLTAFKYSRRLMPGQAETPFKTGTKNFGKGIGALAAGALLGGLLKMSGNRRDTQERSDEDLSKMARRDALGILAQRDVKMSMQKAINDNLSQLQMDAPDLYMRVAAGRLLPQGAVVIGGVPRQDLLQQLGMSMSNGDFNQ